MSEDIATDVNQQIAESQGAPTQERTFSQADVDRTVQARLAREREKMQAQGMGGMNNYAPSIDRDALLQEAEDRAMQAMQRQFDEQRGAYERDMQAKEANEIAKNYLDKMAQGKELYPDFDEVVADFSPGAYPQVTAMATQFDNLPDIMYELNKNPRKLVDLHVLALTNRPVALKEMQRLSQSIKQNEQALVNNVQSPRPLSKLKSSVVAGQDTGKKTVRDLRKESKYRV